MIGLVWLGWQDFSWDRGFIYSLNYLLLSFWYYFIHKFNWFSQNKIFCVFECLFCLSAVLAYVCVCVCVCMCLCLWRIYMSVCVFQLYFFVHGIFLFKTPICLYLGWSLYMWVCVFLCLKHFVNVSLQIVKRLGHYSSFKQFSNFL